MRCGIGCCCSVDGCVVREMNSMYLIDSVRVPRAQAVRAIMLGGGMVPVCSREDAAHPLDVNQRVSVGGVDDKGLPLGELVQQIELTPRHLRKDGWR